MHSVSVVEGLDVVEDRQPGLLSGVEVEVVEPFGLEGVEEAFRLGIILTIPLPAHTTLNAGGFQ